MRHGRRCVWCVDGRGARVLGVCTILLSGILVPLGCSSTPTSRGDRASASARTGEGADAGRTRMSSSQKEAAPSVLRPTISSEPESVEPWTFNGKQGEQITTANYRLFTTEARGILTTRLPLFLETALAHYRESISGAADPLPLPPLKLDTFLLRTRPDWEMLAKQLLGDQAEPFLKIRRGGFAYGGRALLFDLGTFDTFAVTAHEGWHQYTQRTFATPLPIWLEEGIATFMEGHRWDASRGAGPVFLPWANTERFDQLRRAEARKQLMSLSEVLTAVPQNLIAAGTSEPGLNYYAQVWALTHFLNEGAGGKYRQKFREAVQDAASGRMRRVVQTMLGSRAAGGLSGRGPGVFFAYFNTNLDEAAAEYADFIRGLVATGSRSAVVAGQSPFVARDEQGQTRGQGGADSSGAVPSGSSPGAGVQ